MGGWGVGDGDGDGVAGALADGPPGWVAALVGGLEVRPVGPAPLPEGPTGSGLEETGPAQPAASAPSSAATTSRPTTVRYRSLRTAGMGDLRLGGSLHRIVTPELARTPPRLRAMNTPRDVATCAVVAVYLFLALVLDLRLLVLPSLIALACLAGVAVAERTALRR